MKLLDYILIALFFGVGTALSIRRLKNDPELRAILRGRSPTRATTWTT
jgi:hypothetical protein